jgi:hypothetical protein
VKVTGGLAKSSRDLVGLIPIDGADADSIADDELSGAGALIPTAGAPGSVTIYGICLS